MKINSIFVLFAIALVGFGGLMLLFNSSSQPTAVNNFQATIQSQVNQPVILGGPGKVVEIKTVIQKFQYDPDTITVKRGSTVRLTIEAKI